jgi:hypothetical protein
LRLFAASINLSLFASAYAAFSAASLSYSSYANWATFSASILA